MNISAKLHFDSLDKANLSKLFVTLLRIQSAQVNNNVRSSSTKVKQNKQENTENTEYVEWN